MAVFLKNSEISGIVSNLNAQKFTSFQWKHFIYPSQPMNVDLHMCSSIDTAFDTRSDWTEKQDSSTSFQEKCVQQSITFVGDCPSKMKYLENRICKVGVQICFV